MQYSDYIGALPEWAKNDAKVTWIKKSQNETLYGIKTFEMIQCEQRRQNLQRTFNKQMLQHNVTKEAIKLNDAKWLKAKAEKDKAHTELTLTTKDWTELVQDMGKIMTTPEEPVRHRKMPKLKRMVAQTKDKLPVEKTDKEMRMLNHQTTRFKNILKKSKKNAEETHRTLNPETSVATEASVLENLFKLEVSKTINMHAK
jgi:hypothetical protein